MIPGDKVHNKQPPIGTSGVSGEARFGWQVGNKECHGECDASLIHSLALRPGHCKKPSGHGSDGDPICESGR
jgi:hypothetical protein